MLVSAAIACQPRAAQGQSRVDTLRGTVGDSAGRPVAGALVYVTRSPDRQFVTSSTDSAGAFRVTIARGDGTYLITIQAPNFNEVRRVVTLTSRRSLDEHFRLYPSVSQLEAVQVVAARPRPQVGPPLGTSTGAEERFMDGQVGGTAPGDEGNPALITELLPGVATTPTGPAALGTSAAQNVVTIDGMKLSGAMLPRDARARARVATTSFDPTVGGFSGISTSMELQPGIQFGSTRLYVASDIPVAAQPLRLPTAHRANRDADISLASDGMILGDRLGFNIAADGRFHDRRFNALGEQSTAGLAALGLEADNVRRLLTVADSLGIPRGSPGNGDPSSTSGAISARLDYHDGTRLLVSLSAVGNAVTQTGIGVGPYQTPGSSDRRSSALAGTDLSVSRRVTDRLLETARASWTGQRDAVYSTLEFPGISVPGLASSADSAGTTLLATGGSGTGSHRQSQTALEVSSITKWNPASAPHQLQFLLSARRDRASLLSAPGLGTYYFSSLADLASDRPAAFEAVLGRNVRDASVISGTAALGDAWTVTPRLRLIGGIRGEFTRYARQDLNDAALDTLFRIPSNLAPREGVLLPRLGFSWRYAAHGSTEPRVSESAAGSFYGLSYGVLRGGIGLFRTQASPTLLLNTYGLTGGTQREISCAGPDVAPADFGSAVPFDPVAACTTSNGAPAGLPEALAVDPAYRQPVATRANLGWLFRIPGADIDLEGIVSANRHQPESFDRNIAATPAFFLDNEGGRAVYTPPGDIDQSSGRAALATSRAVPAFGRVIEQRSNGRSDAWQTTATINPDLIASRVLTSFSVSLGGSRAQYMGLGDRGGYRADELDWAPAASDSRIQIRARTSVPLGHLGGFSLSYSAMSGLPFTPITDGDVNGDGTPGDRAFVFEPNGPTALAGQMSALLANLPRRLRRCLTHQVGTIAAPGSCRAGWTHRLNARLALPVTDRFWGVISISNVLGLVDAVVHGANDLAGWGDVPNPDPVLLHVTGFDRAAGRFTYTINPHFGSSLSSLSMLTSGYRVTAEFRFSLGPSLGEQEVKRWLGPGRITSGDRLTIAQLQTRLESTVPGIYSLILDQSDSLILTPRQTAALDSLQQRFAPRRDSLWHAAAARLDSMPEAFQTATAMRVISQATDDAWALARGERDNVASVLTPIQRHLLSSLVHDALFTNKHIGFRYFVAR
jgi:Carboxypeptidase regulatory-like domain